MAVIRTDAVLFYDVGIFGEMGYGVPNWSDDIGTNNPAIFDYVDLAGQNLFHIMHHEDAMLRVPPSINTLKRIDTLYKRTGAILVGRAKPPSTPNMESKHVRPAGQVFKVYPVPYFQVRNPWMRRWSEWILMSISEAMQHTENSKSLEISTSFSSLVFQYFHRIYRNMAVDMFQKTAAEVDSPDFILTDADFQAYDPSKFFTETEMVDTPSHLGQILTEDMVKHLREGIAVTELPHLVPHPTNLQTYYQQNVPTPQDQAEQQPGGTTAAAKVPDLP